MEGSLHSFDEVALPHLDAAYNLARWLTRNDKDAEDVAQEAFLRAFRHFGSFQGGDARPWLLAIVRNTYYTWIRHNRVAELETPFDEETYAMIPDSLDPEMQLVREADNEMLRDALEELPAELREILVLREFEDLSYKEIAQVAKIPLGTVMSRLARARKRLERILTRHDDKETCQEIGVEAL